MDQATKPIGETKMNEQVVKKMDMVVKSNRLVESLQSLNLSEIRLIQLAIVDSRDQGKGLDTKTPLRIDAMRYAQIFDISKQGAYKVLKDAEQNLFRRYFTFLSERNNKVRTNWIQQAEYFDDEGAIEIIFTTAVVDEITRIDGFEQMFTQYALSQIADLNSNYSVRLYELLKQWTTAKKVTFELERFREQLGIGINEYPRMSDFKRRVLDVALTEINSKTDIVASYEQEKKGRKITGFKFKVLTKNKPSNTKIEKNSRDADTADMFTIEGLNDKQLGRIVRNPAFMADYNHLVSPTSPAGQSQQVWESEMINRLKKDASEFTKRPIRGYLDY